MEHPKTSASSWNVAIQTFMFQKELGEAELFSFEQP